MCIVFFSGKAKLFFDTDSRFLEAKKFRDVFDIIRSRFVPAVSRAATKKHAV